MLLVDRRQSYSADEFLALPEDGYRYELVNGQIRELDTSSMRHGLITVQCSAAVKNFCDKNQAGSVFIGSAFVLDYQNVVCPDISFVSAGRMSGIDLDEVMRIPPDLAIAVVSRNETTGNVQDKIERYQAAGTKLNWSIYLAGRFVLVHRAGDAKVQLLNLDDELDGENIFARLAATG